MLTAAVFVTHVVKNFTSAFLAEIDIEVRHGFTFDIEKPLKNQAVGDWVDIGYGHRISGQASSSRSAPGPDWNIVVFGPVDEIGNDQKIARKTHLVDDVYLHVETVSIEFFSLRGQWGFFSHRSESPLEPFTAGLGEHGFEGLTFRQRKIWEMILTEFNFQITALGNLDSIDNGFGAIVEAFFHLLR